MDPGRFVEGAARLEGELIARRRDFHQHPELGFQEHRTAGIVASELEALGLEVQRGLAETGVVGVLEGARMDPVLLLRFDMDALPIQEQSQAAYASTTPGVMHACGHDGHTAIGLAAARLLTEARADLPGRVKFVFQPAEEGLGGGKRMVEEGVLESPKPDMALAMHLWNERPNGWYGIGAGPVMAGAERFEIDLEGSGGHGAAPHLARDPVIAAAHLVSALQTVVSRDMDPLDTVVVSVTQLQAGEAFNVIPASARLCGTIRTFTAEARERVSDRLRRISVGVADAHRCRAKVAIEQVAPPVVNDARVGAVVREAVEELFPGAKVDSEHRTTGSEDMAYLMAESPGCYLFAGSGNTAKGLDAPHHNPRFDFDEGCLKSAAALISAAAWRLLESR
jgi:amidohydrolase